jgi:hypothetical protein
MLRNPKDKSEKDKKGTGKKGKDKSKKRVDEVPASKGK